MSACVTLLHVEYHRIVLICTSAPSLTSFTYPAASVGDSTVQGNRHALKSSRISRLVLMQRKLWCSSVWACIRHHPNPPGLLNSGPIVLQQSAERLCLLRRDEGASKQTKQEHYVAALMQRKLDCRNWRLVLTGHSLGAGAAALIALHLSGRFPSEPLLHPTL